MSDDRSVILERLTRTGQPTRTEHPQTDWPQGYPDPRDQAHEIFARELTTLGVPLHTLGDREKVEQVCADLVRELKVTTAVRWSGELPEIELVQQALEAAGVTFIQPEQDECFADAAARAELGLSGVDAAVAESGTIVLAAGPGRERSASLLPPTHLAVLTPHTPILPGILDLGTWLAEQSQAGNGLPSGVHCITGPSSTADIELVKVIGVHGPVRLVVLYLEVE